MAKFTNNKKIKALYFGWLGYNNLGDEILFKAHNKLFPDLDFIIHDKTKAINFKPDIVFLGGGTFINRANYCLPIFEKFLDEKIPIVCIGTGVANLQFWKNIKTFDDQMDRWTKVLKKFSYLGVRGPLSTKILQSYNLTNVNMVGDTALALTNDKYQPLTDRKIIGINIGTSFRNIWGLSEIGFFDKISKVCQQLVKSGWQIYLLPVWPEDLIINHAIQNIIGKKSCKLYENIWNDFTQYQKLLNKCQVFIGEKLHSTIFATMNRIPSIMLEYRPKCLDYMSSIKQEKYNIRTNEINIKKIMSLVNELEDNSLKTQKDLDRNILTLKRKLFDSAKEIRQIYLKKT